MDHVVDHGQAVIEKGSGSFAAAAKLFDPETRGRAYMLYAWCRHCDDQTDDQELGFDGSQLPLEEGRARVDRLRAETLRALSGIDSGRFGPITAISRKNRRFSLVYGQRRCYHPRPKPPVRPGS